MSVAILVLVGLFGGMIVGSLGPAVSRWIDSRADMNRAKAELDRARARELTSKS